MPDTTRARLIELIEYARQTALMRDAPKATVEDYRSFAEYEHSLQNLPGIHIDASPADGSDETWLSIERLRESLPPHIEDPMLAVWTDLANDPSKIPSLKSFVHVRDLMTAGFDSANQIDMDDRIPLESISYRSELEN